MYPEEVTHCAAGVRWLTWLHGRAHATAGRPVKDPIPRSQSSTDGTAAGGTNGTPLEPDSVTASDPLVDDVLAMADKLNQQCSLSSDAREDMERRAGHARYCACCGPGAPDTDDAMDTGEAGYEAGGVPAQAWEADALQFDTVEEWFHALVRRHFHGALKGPFNEVARHEAGLLPTWYLPLAGL